MIAVALSVDGLALIVALLRIAAAIRDVADAIREHGSKENS